jgi:hypothetical protein
LEEVLLVTEVTDLRLKSWTMEQRGITNPYG